MVSPHKGLATRGSISALLYDWKHTIEQTLEFHDGGFMTFITMTNECIMGNIIVFAPYILVNFAMVILTHYVLNILKDIHIYIYIYIILTSSTQLLVKQLPGGNIKFIKVPHYWPFMRGGGYRSSHKWAVKTSGAIQWRSYKLHLPTAWLCINMFRQLSFFDQNYIVKPLERNISLDNWVWGSIKPVWLLQPSLLHRFMSCYFKHLCTNICFSDISSLRYWYMYNWRGMSVSGDV